MALHPNLMPVSELVGTWQGPGHGDYPTIENFEYTEELTFTDVGKPFLHYAQRTWSPAGVAMHVETGYVRVPGDGTIELVLALPTGQTELAEGSLIMAEDGFEAELTSQVVNSASAKAVETTVRRLRLAGDELRTEFEMAAVGIELTLHLSSVLTRQG